MQQMQRERIKKVEKQLNRLKEKRLKMTCEEFMSQRGEKLSKKIEILEWTKIRLEDACAKLSRMQAG